MTAYEMRISDWSSDVCSSDLRSLRWQRLTPFEKFADLIERHWAGITAYCQPENKVALGFVEGLNNKIRVIQRRCYGIRDEDYLHRPEERRVGKGSVSTGRSRWSPTHKNKKNSATKQRN